MKQVGKWVGLTAAVVLSFSLVACSDVPNNMTDGREKMENEGYTITTLSTDDILIGIGTGVNLGAKVAIECKKEATEDYLLAIWFETEENAKNFQIVFKMFEGAFFETELKNANIKTTYRNGELVYCGTEQACEDFTA